MDSKLNWKDKLSLVVETGLQLVPYVGGALSTAYFGTQQEKRFKRLESFYQEFSYFITQNETTLQPIHNHDEEKLVALIEELNEKVERESTVQKRNYFKNFLLNTLSTPTNENFDERRFFLDTLSNMTLLECEILQVIKQQSEPVMVRNLEKPGTDLYAIVGCIGRLRLYGFIKLQNTNIMFNGGDDSLNDSFVVSDFGKRFIEYCIE